MLKKNVFIQRLWQKFRLLTALSLTLFLFLTVISALLVIQPARAYEHVGPKEHYLALGDSIAFGYQPDFDFQHGYVDYFFTHLKGHGTKHLANLSCSGETSGTMIAGKCRFAMLRKFPYLGAQLDAALTYLKANRGKVSPVTLTIGSNDLLSAINTKTCQVDVEKFNKNLALIDANLTQNILPRLQEALTVDGEMTGDIVMMNYYNSFQNSCPSTTPYVQTLNQHLAHAASDYGIIVDTFSSFGGAKSPNPLICSHTWMCSVFKDIHANDRGHRIIADTFIKAYSPL